MDCIEVFFGEVDGCVYCIVNVIGVDEKGCFFIVGG